MQHAWVDNKIKQHEGRRQQDKRQAYSVGHMGVARTHTLNKASHHKQRHRAHKNF